MKIKLFFFLLFFTLTACIFIDGTSPESSVSDGDVTSTDSSDSGDEANESSVRTLGNVYDGWPNVCEEYPEECGKKRPFEEALPVIESNITKKSYLTESSFLYPDRDELITHWTWEGLDKNSLFFKRLEKSLFTQGIINKESAYNIAFSEIKEVIPEIFPLSFRERVSATGRLAYTYPLNTLTFYDKCWLLDKEGESSVPSEYQQVDSDSRLYSTYKKLTPDDYFSSLSEEGEKKSKDAFEEPVIDFLYSEASSLNCVESQCNERLAESLIGLFQRGLFSFPFAALYWSLWQFDEEIVFSTLGGLSGVEFFSDNGELDRSKTHETLFASWDRKSKADKLKTLRSYLFRFSEDFSALYRSSGKNYESDMIVKAAASSLTKNLVDDGVIKRLFEKTPLRDYTEYGYSEENLDGTYKPYAAGDNGKTINFCGRTYTKIS